MVQALPLQVPSSKPEAQFFLMHASPPSPHAGLEQLITHVSPSIFNEGCLGKGGMRR